MTIICQDVGVDEVVSQAWKFYAYVKTMSGWMNRRVKSYLRARIPDIIFIGSLADFPGGKNHLIQFANHDWGYLEAFDVHFQAGKLSMINAFPNVDALARKDYLAGVASYWMAKCDKTVLKGHIPTTVALEVDYAEWLDDALIEADSFELCASMELNETKEPCDREWWILKPAMCDRGYGIRLFSTKDDLSRCFQSVEDIEDDDDESTSTASAIPTSLLRRFVAQRYVSSPRTFQGKKFHIRAYVVALGRLKVFVYRDMIVLLASNNYQPPWLATDPRSYLTNTAIQARRQARYFWDIEEHLMPSAWKDKVFEQICQVSAEIFLAAARTMPSRFNVVNGSFETFGLDFLIDTSGSAWLLEVNSGPAYYDKKLSRRLLDAVVYRTLKETLGNRIPMDKPVHDSMIEVLDEDFGQSNIGGIWTW
ncbi:putative tubulin--tyrosine ligase [Paramyrothecium foliicola]|nr:putative tubulin--tyrosine ligase [Paramyrothecium foliicola]